MKRLFLLRHAKSGMDDPSLRDFDRPLNERGRRAARTVGEHAASIGLAFDWIIASPAVRVEQTLGLFLRAAGADIDAVVWDRRAYLASSATLLDIVRETPGSARTLLLAGHNPGMEDVAMGLGERKDGDAYQAIAQKYPTGALAEISLDTDDWGHVTFGGGSVTRFVRPRDLDPELGPE